MIASYAHSPPNNRGLIFNNASIAPSLSSESAILNNLQERDTLLDLEVTVTALSNPGTNPYLELRLLYSTNGTTFESSSTADRVDIVPLQQGTIVRFLHGIHVDPYHIRLYAFNASGVTVSLTVRAFTRRMQLET